MTLIVFATLHAHVMPCYMLYQRYTSTVVTVVPLRYGP